MVMQQVWSFLGLDASFQPVFSDRNVASRAVAGAQQWYGLICPHNFSCSKGDGTACEEDSRAPTRWPMRSGSTTASTRGSQMPPHLLGRRESAGCGRVIGRPHLLSPRGGRTRTSSQAGRVSCATRRCPRAGTKPVKRGESRTQDRLHLLLHK